MRKKRYLFYVLTIWTVLLIPLVGMVWYPTESSAEKKELTKWPVINADNWWDLANLVEMSTYFEDHFSFRQEMITANSFIRSGLLKSETTDQVIVGNNGWLYFSGDLNDFQEVDILSKRELNCIMHNLNLMNNYIEQQGSRMILTIAPNKSTLYGNNMPYYYLEGESSNLQLLTKLLENTDITYVDLDKLFQEQEDVLYFQKDSHWTTKGAVLVYNALMEKMGLVHETYENHPYTVENNHTGDLEEMLYPMAIEKEDDIVYEKEASYIYVNDIIDNMDSWIETSNPDKETKLLMYRDSFGEKLLPFIADAVGEGYFSRLVPYNLAQVVQYMPDYVIIERVERKIAAFAVEIPVMEGPLVNNVDTVEIKTDTTIEVNTNGSYLVVKGTTDETYINTDTEIYIAVEEVENEVTKTYQPFYTLTEAGNGNGYQLYLNSVSMPKGSYQINVITINNELAHTVAVMSWEK